MSSSREDSPSIIDRFWSMLHRAESRELNPVKLKTLFQSGRLADYLIFPTRQELKERSERTERKAEP